MSLDERISNLIRRIYCAGSNVGEWDAVAKLILQRTGACAALTTLVDLEDREYDATRFYGLESSRAAQGIEEYKETFRHDPSLIWASANPSARFCDSGRTVGHAYYLQHPFIKWNCDRFGSTHWYVGYTPPEERLSFSFSIHFPSEQGPGSPTALRLFRMLFDHMHSAMWLNHRPFNAESDTPLVLLDRRGHVRDVSRGALSVLAQADGLTIVDRRLTPCCRGGSTDLEKAFSQAAGTCAEGSPVTAVKIARPSGRKPWLLTIKPLLASYGPFGKVHNELLVHIHDGKPRMGPPQILQGLFGFTERELQVLQRLAEGHSLETLATCLGISSNTVRAHLRAIFVKTGTNRQADVLQLCADLAIP